MPNKDLVVRAAYAKEYYVKNREVVLLRARKYRAENKENIKKYRKDNRVRDRSLTLKRKFGISLEQWDEMFTQQGNCCAICERDNPGSKIGWHTDHCHKTNKVRGILCQPCNLALGSAMDSIDTLFKMIDYLEKHNGQDYEGTICGALQKLPRQAGTNPQSKFAESGQGRGGETAWC